MRKFIDIFILMSLLYLAPPPLALAEAINCDPDPGTNMEIKYSDTILCVFEGPVGIADTDTFYFLGSAGDLPFIQVSALKSSSLALYGPDGSLLAFTGGGGKNPSIDDTLLVEDGIHTIIAKSGTTVEDTPYTLELPCLSGKCRDEIAPDALGFHAVSPCRIVDTRYGIGGAMSAGETRHFHSYGDVTNQNSAAGGAPLDYPDTCPFALGEHEAVLLNVTVVPMGTFGQGGFATLWPWDETRPNSSWINYVAGAQNIANAGVVKTTASTGADPDFSVYALRNLHLVIDAMGYFTE